MTTHSSFSKAREEFERAWNDPAHTRIEPDPVDVNALLHDYYSSSEPLRLTKPMLWDAEVKKAWDPGTYIPGVVSEGEAWGRECKSLEELRGVCSHVGAIVLPMAVSVARVQQVFDEEGNCQDADTEKLIRSAAH